MVSSVVVLGIGVVRGAGIEIIEYLTILLRSNASKMHGKTHFQTKNSKIFWGGAYANVKMRLYAYECKNPGYAYGSRKTKLSK